MDALIDVQAVATEAFATLDTGRQIEPFSSRLSSFNLDDAYRVTAAVRKMREIRGELPVGRKIGFTNHTIWAEYDVYEPVWGYVYDHTVKPLRDRRYVHGMSPNGSIYLMQERQRCKDPSNVARTERVQSNSRTKGVG